jgi:hypothetical protein
MHPAERVPSVSQSGNTETLSRDLLPLELVVFAKSDWGCGRWCVVVYYGRWGGGLCRGCLRVILGVAPMIFSRV